MDLSHVLDLAHQFRYLLIFPLTIVEGPIIMVLVGYLVSQGSFNFLTAYIVLAAGDLTGDVLYYIVGHSLRHPVLWQWRHWFGLNDERIKWLEDRFHTSTGKILVFGKAIHGIGGVIIMGAGLTKIPFPRFIYFNILGTIPKVLLLMLLGFFFGFAYQQIDRYLKIGAYAGFIGLLIAIVVGAVLLQRTKPKAL